MIIYKTTNMLDKEGIRDMPLWLTIFLSFGGSTLISLTVTFIFNRLTNGMKKKKKDAKIIAEAIEEKNEILRRSVQALLRHELYDLYDKYYNHYGYAPLDVKNDFENIYNCYHNLGKNGVMDGIHIRFMSLVDEPKAKKQVLNENQQ